MKIRTLILVIFILLVAALVALNAEEILRPATLNLGLTQIQAPVGLVLLGVMTLMMVAFLLTLVVNQTAHLMEVRRITKEVAEQRNLADKAEASRLTDLREYLHTQFLAIGARDQETLEKLQQKMGDLQTRITEAVEQTGNGLGASLGELEDRVEQQFKRPSNL
jgi:uncharacterized integral membrane protein